ncbi:MAG TPA: DUF433 domain-containing protein [Aggregatilineales bacterium]|nr:DUF433 domain-containing protein [Aggregatilineales bacterium]
MKTPLIDRSDEILSGTPVFHATRVPVRTLIDYLTGGETLDEFLDDFPTVSRELALQFLERAEQQARNAQSLDGASSQAAGDHSSGTGD